MMEIIGFTAVEEIAVEIIGAILIAILITIGGILFQQFKLIQEHNRALFGSEKNDRYDGLISNASRIEKRVGSLESKVDKVRDKIEKLDTKRVEEKMDDINPEQD